MKFNTAIFDLDGTLLDTLRDIANSVNAALEKNNLPTHDVLTIRSFIGNGAINLIEKSLPTNYSNALLNKVYADFTVHYALHKNDNTKPFDGIYELLEELKAKGVTIGIFSNKPDKATKDLAIEVFPNLIDYAKGATNDTPIKPAPDGLFKILEIIDKKPEECVFIGDSDVDILTGKNAEIYTVGVTWGFRSTEELIKNGADKIVNHAKEIIELF